MDGIKNISIRNFRGISHLWIDELSSVNLFLSKNTKIYGYLEALLGNTKSQKELIKKANRDYENPQHWNLEAEYLEPMKAFLENNIIQKEAQ